MKFYTLTYDCNRPTKQQINVPTNSDFKVGVKIFRNDEEQMLEPTEVTLGNLSADPEKTNGYVTFTQATGDEAKMEISKISVDHVAPETEQARDIRKGQQSSTSLYLSANVELVGKNILPSDIYFRFYNGDSTATSSTVEEALDAKPYNAFHVKGGNINQPQTTVVARKQGDPSDRSRQLFVPDGAWDSMFRAKTKEEQLALCVNPEDLPPVGVDYFLGIALIDEQTEKWKIFLNYTLKEDDFFVYTTGRTTARTYKGCDLKIQIGQSFNTNFDLAVNTFKSQQGDIELQAPEGTATQEWVEDYVSGELEDYATTEYVDNAVSGKVSGSSVGQAPAILSATSVYASDWATLSSTADENTMYVVLPDPVTP